MCECVFVQISVQELATALESDEAHYAASLKPSAEAGQQQGVLEQQQVLEQLRVGKLSYKQQAVHPTILEPDQQPDHQVGDHEPNWRTQVSAKLNQIKEQESDEMMHRLQLTARRKGDAALQQLELKQELSEAPELIERLRAGQISFQEYKQQNTPTNSEQTSSQEAAVVAQPKLVMQNVPAAAAVEIVQQTHASPMGILQIKPNKNATTFTTELIKGEHGLGLALEFNQHQFAVTGFNSMPSGVINPGRAASARLEPGDRIVAVNGVSVHTVELLSSQVADSPQQLHLTIERPHTASQPPAPVKQSALSPAKQPNNAEQPAKQHATSLDSVRNSVPEHADGCLPTMNQSSEDKLGNASLRTSNDILDAMMSGIAEHQSQQPASAPGQTLKDLSLAQHAPAALPPAAEAPPVKPAAPRVMPASVKERVVKQVTEPHCCAH